MLPMKTCFLLLNFILLSVAGLYAQSETGDVPEMVTDRPDQTESPVIVPKGFLQLETGPYLMRDNGKKQEWSYTSLLLRVGIVGWLELRLVGSYEGQLTARMEGDVLEEGLAPLILGTKIALWQAQGAIPQTALMYHITLPNTGSRNSRLEYPKHELRANFSNTLSDKLELGYNIGAIWQEIDAVEGLYTLSFAYDLTNKLGLFAETYGTVADDEKNEHAVDGGLTFLLWPTFQLDAYVGRGLSENAADWMFGAGFSWRIPR